MKPFNLFLSAVCLLLAGFVLGAWYLGQLDNLEFTFAFGTALFGGAMAALEL